MGSRLLQGLSRLYSFPPQYRADVGGIAIRAAVKDGASRDQHIRPRLDDERRRLGVDAAVHLKVDTAAGRVDPLAKPAYFFELRGDKFLPAKARIDAHHQNEIDLVHHMLEGRGGC